MCFIARTVVSKYELIMWTKSNWIDEFVFLYKTNTHLEIIIKLMSLMFSRINFKSDISFTLPFKSINEFINTCNIIVKFKNIISFCPGWCSSVDWVQACEQKGPSVQFCQGTCLGCGPGPQWGALERRAHLDGSLSVFLFPFPSL